MELREKIIIATIDEFNENSIKFTMDDIAKKLGISKKTIYTWFKNKDALFFAALDYCNENLKYHEKKIIEDTNLDVKQKLKKIIIDLPKKHKNLDVRQIHITKEKSPKVYYEIVKRTESLWEPMFYLLHQEISKKKIRPISMNVFKVMIEATIIKFISTDVLVDNNMKYEDALNEMIDIIMMGIEVN